VEMVGGGGGGGGPNVMNIIMHTTQTNFWQEHWEGFGGGGSSNAHSRAGREF